MPFQSPGPGEKKSSHSTEAHVDIECECKRGKALGPSYENVQLLLLYFFEYDTISFFLIMVRIFGMRSTLLNNGIVKYRYNEAGRSLDSHSHQQCTLPIFKLGYLNVCY